MIDVSSQSQLAQLLLEQPVVGGTRTLCAAVLGYAVVLESVNDDSEMIPRIIVCSKTDNGDSIVQTDNVENITGLSDLPCSTELVSEDDINGGVIFDFMSDLADEGPWDSFDFEINNREEFPGLSITCKWQND